MNDLLIKELIAELKKLSKKLDEVKSLKRIPTTKCRPNLFNKYYDSAQMRVMFHLSDSKLQDMRKQKRIPFLKIGRKYLYPTDAINSMFNN